MIFDEDKESDEIEFFFDENRRSHQNLFSLLDHDEFCFEKRKKRKSSLKNCFSHLMDFLFCFGFFE